MRILGLVCLSSMSLVFMVGCSTAKAADKSAPAPETQSKPATAEPAKASAAEAAKTAAEPVKNAPSTTKPLGWNQASRSRPAEWYKSDEARRIADNVLIYQAANGGWNKNIDMARPLSQEQIDKIVANRDHGTTLDNGATHTQIRFMANMYVATGEKKYYDSFMKGVNYILEAQYPNGGWPQYYPLKKGYSTHITFNDGAMLGAMRVLDNIARGIKPFDIVKDEALKAKCKVAVSKGVDCILKCQISEDGKKTVWCQQHDEVTLAPAPARKFELVSLSGSESAGICRFLMDIDNPSPQVKEAVEGAVVWFNKVKINGIKQTYVPDANGKNGMNKVEVEDPSAGPMWARFYEIGTNKPIFVDRDSVARYNLEDIGYERRNGYAWLGGWGQMVLDGYPVWAAKWTPGRNVLAAK
jgi:PelA/Pel-15E family pectate lyase